MKIDRFPSTPVHLISAWLMAVITWGAGLYKALFAGTPNLELYYAAAALVAAYGGFGVAQFIGKRSTAWAPPETASEVTKPPEAGQPAKPIAGGE
jgi:hypothetical protein